MPTPDSLSAAARATVFDLDGTLADSVGIIEDNIHLTLTDAGHEAERPAIRAMIGRPLTVALADLTGQDEDHENIATMVEAYRTSYHPAIEKAGAGLLLPGVREMLERLRSAGHAIGVVTAKSTAGAEHLLDIIDIRDLVDTVVGTDRVAHGKPAPDSGLLALEELGADAADTWYVGDAVSDMGMAIAAGMKPLGVISGVEGRDALLAAGALAVADTPGQVASIVLEGVPDPALR